MKGLRTTWIGAKHMLHSVTQDVAHDPEIWAILQTFRDARDLPDMSTLPSWAYLHHLQVVSK